MNYYSNLTRNDKFVHYIFGDNHYGVYIEAGACDGIKDSNTYFLDTRLNWSGIVVEPSSLFQELLQNRLRAKCFNCCVGKLDNQIIDFTEFNDSGYKQLSCTDQSLLELKEVWLYNKALNESTVTNKKIQMRTIDSLLKETGESRVIDYLSLDVEGSESDVIEGINFDTTTILLISAEGMWTNPKLERFGYKKVKNPFDESGNPKLVTWLPKDKVRPWDCWWVSPVLFERKKEIFKNLVYNYFDFEKNEYIIN